jgi:hypothetical protein
LDTERLTNALGKQLCIAGFWNERTFQRPIWRYWLGKLFGRVSTKWGYFPSRNGSFASEGFGACWNARYAQSDKAK